MQDIELLREYVERQSEAAFTELVQRHSDLVYSTALRIVRDPGLAEDVTQLVFIRLTARPLREGTILAGWLYRTTQFVAQTALRSDWRRRKREHLAMACTEPDAESVWSDIAPLLERAVGQLRQADQDAVLLRFFAGKSLREVGQALGISDDAAQKRVNRALEHLRDFFATHGVVASIGVLAPAIAAHAVHAAPVGLAAKLLTASVAGAGGKLGFAMSFDLLKAMALAKLKTAAGGALATAILLLAGTAVFVRSLPAASETAAVAEPPSTAALTLRGTVRTPDGKPLAGALVRVATPQNYVRLYQTTNAAAPTNVVARTNRPGAATNRLVKPPSQALVTNSAADGSFLFALSEMPKDGLAAVAVNSDAGYAVVTAGDLASNADVIVQPWARIEGVLRIGKSPASNQTVQIGIWGSTELFDWNLVQHNASTRTDADGRFVFPRVAPVDIWLTHLVMVKSNDWRPIGHHYVKVSPGDQIKVQLGGSGHAVTGRVALDANLVFYGSMWADAAPGIRHPRNWNSLPREQQRKIERAWRDSPAGDLFKDSVRNYEFPVQPDGAFRVEDVVPGTYRMQVRADEPIPGGTGMRHAAVVEVRVGVPELNVGQAEEPIDVGVLVPKPAKGPR